MDLGRDISVDLLSYRDVVPALIGSFRMEESFHRLGVYSIYHQYCTSSQMAYSVLLRYYSSNV